MKPEDFENAKFIMDESIENLAAKEAVNASNEKDNSSAHNKPESNLSLKSKDVKSANLF